MQMTSRRPDAVMTGARPPRLDRRRRIERRNREFGIPSSPGKICSPKAPRNESGKVTLNRGGPTRVLSRSRCDFFPFSSAALALERDAYAVTRHS